MKLYFFLLFGTISCSNFERNKFDVITQQAKCLRSEMYLSDEKTGLIIKPELPQRNYVHISLFNVILYNKTIL